MREEHSGKSAKHFSVRNGLNTICYSDQRFRESLNRFGSDVELISLRYEAITAIMHMARTVTALQTNELAEQTPLFIYCDGARNEKEAERVRQVREQAKTVTGFKSVTVVERERNYGLAGSIIDGVGRLCEQYGRVIVVEDDLITSPDFLRYMNQGLDLYADEERVASIHGYSYPVPNDDAPESYFLRGADCWGWATWARAWKHFEPNGAKLLMGLKEKGLAKAFDYGGNAFFLAMLRNQIKGKNQSWAIRWHGF